jgi:large subunit ribosomal protein L4
MPALTKIDESGAAIGEAELDDGLIEAEANIGLLHEVVRAEMAAHRQGTHKAKSRGEVNGGGAKPWRQKGTGRARAGSSRIPHWTGGGVAFPPTPRDHSFKINKKARAKAFRQALGNLVENGNVRVLAGLEFEVPSTNRAVAILASSGLPAPYLVVGDPMEVNLLLSFRNLPHTRVLPIGEVEVQDYIWARSLVYTEACVEWMMADGDEVEA